MTDTVNIKGIDKAKLLAALYNRGRPMGMGFLRAQPGDMTLEEAQKLVAGGDSGDYPGGPLKGRGGDIPYFDYVYGRPLKVNLNGDKVSSWGYDRDNGGTGSFAKIVKKLREEAA